MITQSEDEIAVFAYLITQYNLKSGLREFGKKEVLAAENELRQLRVIGI